MRLKPTVLTLARLLELVSTMVCWAFMPVAAVKRARIIRYLLVPKLCWRTVLHRRVRSLLHGVGQGAQGLGRRLILPQTRDHLHHFLDHLYIGAFAVALADQGGRGLRLNARRRREQGGADALELVYVVEGCQPKLPNGYIVCRYRAILGDLNLSRVGRNTQRSIAPTDGVAVRADQFAVGIEVELAVARVQGAVRPIRDEEAIALDGALQRITRMLISTCGKGRGISRNLLAMQRRIRRRSACRRGGRDKLLKGQHLPAIAGDRGVSEVLGQDVLILQSSAHARDRKST